MESSENSPELHHNMNPLSSVEDEMRENGFIEDFKVEDEALKVNGTDKAYTPEQVKIVNFFRFEGSSDPGDMSILYAIETHDGVKGTLVDAFGTYSNPEVDDFIKQVQEINKKNTNTNVTPEQLQS